MHITLLICTYNRQSLLERCLAHVSALRLEENTSCEVLVVDNASGDGTSAFVQQWIPQCPHPARLLHEPRQGVAHARRRGFEASTGEWIAFVDDDCFLHPDYVVEAARFIAAHPDAGVIGSRNALLWEEPPTPLLEAYGESLARQEWGDEESRIPEDAGKKAFCGAGMLLRREALAASAYLSQGTLQGRHPRTVGAGEDTEVQLLIRNAGWAMWYAPKVRLQHWVPKERTTQRHLLALHRGFGDAEMYLRLLGERQKRPFPLAARWAMVKAAWVEMRAVLDRFWLGCVKYKNERPIWYIRLWYAWGCLRGATRLLLWGRVR